MRKIVLASHHLLADGLKDTIQYLMPTLTDIQSVSAYMDNVPVKFFKGIAPAQYVAFTTQSSVGTIPVTLRQLKEALGEINEDNEYIIFTDMLGGSVNQEAVKYLQYPNVYVITGMNLPIVLSVCLSLASCEKVNEDVIRNAIDDAKSQIVYVNDVMKNMRVDEDDE